MDFCPIRFLTRAPPHTHFRDHPDGGNQRNGQQNQKQSHPEVIVVQDDVVNRDGNHQHQKPRPDPLPFAGGFEHFGIPQGCINFLLLEHITDGHLRLCRRDFVHRAAVFQLSLIHIYAATIPQFAGLGIDGAAVVSAIVAQPDIEAAARNLRQLCDKTFSK